MNQETLKIAIGDLRERIIKHDDQIKRSEDAINALQNLCEHDFEPSGRDSHYSYEKCKWCGIEQKT